MLSEVDDTALHRMDWKPMIGQYLVRAKYFILRWLDDPERSSPHDMIDEIGDLAEDQGIVNKLGYRPPQLGSLLDAATNYQEVKDHLIEGDQAYVEIEPNSEAPIRHDVNVTVAWNVDTIADLITSDTSVSESTMNLIVKKPDFLGDSKWDFRHGKRTISAKIEDEGWLRDFQNRKINVLPGYALKCRVRTELAYDASYELISTRYFIQEVLEVIAFNYDDEQSFFFGQE